MWKKLLPFTLVIFLHINGWELHFFCIPSCLITSIPFLHVRAGNLVESMTADLAGEVTSAAGPVRLEDLQRILSAIQSSGTSLKVILIVWAFPSYMLIWNFYLHSPDISGAAADPDAGKRYCKLMRSCYRPTRFLLHLLVHVGGCRSRTRRHLEAWSGLAINWGLAHWTIGITSSGGLYPGFQINRTLQLSSWPLLNSRVAHGVLVISLSFSKVLLCANN